MTAAAKDWRVKVAVQNLVSLLPRPIAFELNERLVRVVAGTVRERGLGTSRVLKGLANIRLVQEHAAFRFANARVLEVGTGWHGIDLMLFSLLGASRITTIDHAPHLSLENLRAHVDLVAAEECRAAFEEAGVVPERLSALIEAARSARTLAEFLEFLKVRYLTVQSSEYDRLPLDAGSVDFFYSESVLQRIPERHLGALLKRARELMSPSAVFFHRTDQKDINAQDHLDSTRWHLAYLSYSGFVFNTFLSSKLNSQNRLRESDFLDLFNGAGLKVAYVESTVRSSDMERMRGFQVDHRFRGKALEDLCTIATKFLGQRGDAVAALSFRRVVSSD